VSSWDIHLPELSSHEKYVLDSGYKVPFNVSKVFIKTLEDPSKKLMAKRFINMSLALTGGGVRGSVVG
jgi:hypothetical protein